MHVADDVVATAIDDAADDVPVRMDARELERVSTAQTVTAFHSSPVQTGRLKAASTYLFLTQP